MSELFAPSEVTGDSPRKKWMAKHDVTTIDHGESGTDELGDYERWTAHLGEIRPVVPNRFIAGGETEHEALVNLALKNGWKLWNEE